MRRGLIRATIIVAVALDFFTPEGGVIEAFAQAGPISGNAYEWENGRITPSAMMMVDPLALQQRATVNSDGSTNARPVILSTPGGPGAVTLTTTSTSVIPQGAKKFIAIDNESGSATIACSFGGTAALNTAGSFTIPPQSVRIWNGPAWVPADVVNCVSASSSSPATIQVQ